MEILAHHLMQGVYFFLNNWIAAAILALVIILAAIKKPKELFKVTALLALMVGMLYLMIFIEKSMFSGASSTKEGMDKIERGIN